MQPSSPDRETGRPSRSGNLADVMANDSYSGIARILDRNGMLLDVGKAELTVTDSELGGWGGTVKVYKGSCLASKSLTVLVELADGSRALAQVGPEVGRLAEDLIDVKVIGIDTVLFD